MIETSILIVTFNSRHLIDRCLNPLINRDDRTEILIWDNASNDGTPLYIRESYPDIKVHVSAENLGFAAANNRLMEMAQGPAIMLLNPDAFLEDMTQVSELIAQLADQDVALVGPQLIHPNGQHQIGDCGWRLSLQTATNHFLFLHRIFPALKGYYLSNPRLLLQSSVDVDWVSGACLVARRSVVQQIGGLDERIFMYGEDVEWGERARSAGYRVVYLPKVRVLHLQGGTQRKEADVFISTRWLDSMFRRAALNLDGPGNFALRVVVFLGLAIRTAHCAARWLWSPNSSSRGRLTAFSRYTLSVLGVRHPGKNRPSEL